MMRLSGPRHVRNEARTNFRSQPARCGESIGCSDSGRSEKRSSCFLHTDAALAMRDLCRSISAFCTLGGKISFGSATWNCGRTQGGGHYLRGISLCCTAAFEWPIAPIYVHRSGLRHPGLRAPWCFSSNFSVFLLQQPFKTGLRDHDQLYYCRFTLSTWITSTNT
jgi:hypothetical protein